MNNKSVTTPSWSADIIFDALSWQSVQQMSPLACGHRELIVAQITP